MGCPIEYITKFLLALMLTAGDAYFFLNLNLSETRVSPRPQVTGSAQEVPAPANTSQGYRRAEMLLCLIWLEGKELNSPFGRAVSRGKWFSGSLVGISWARR